MRALLDRLRRNADELLRRQEEGPPFDFRELVRATCAILEVEAHAPRMIDDAADAADLVAQLAAMVNRDPAELLELMEWRGLDLAAIRADLERRRIEAEARLAEAALREEAQCAEEALEEAEREAELRSTAADDGDTCGEAANPPSEAAAPPQDAPRPRGSVVDTLPDSPRAEGRGRPDSRSWSPLEWARYRAERGIRGELEGL